MKTGDFIAFDSVEGRVEKISARSTTIRKLDNSRIIVPNSQLTQKRLINYDYVDKETETKEPLRINIEVGVAYGSDIVLVIETILNSALIEPNVLSDPPPKVFLLALRIML